MSCQTEVFKSIAESELPLSTHNLIALLDYSEDAIRKSISNLRRNRLIESTGYRHFLTTEGQAILRNNGAVFRLDRDIGSYTRSSTHVTTKKDFIARVKAEASKSLIGQHFLANITDVLSRNPAPELLAPWVVFFAIHAGLITEPTKYDTKTDPKLDEKQQELIQILGSYFK